MRRAWLHIGMNKAGSTTLQVALRAYDAPGVTWLQVPGFTQTQAVCLPFRARPSPLLFTEADQDGQRARARAALDQALGATAKSVMLSSEFLSDFADVTEVSALVDALGAHVDEVHALAYLRAPGAYLSSVWQETLKLRLPPPALGRLWPRYRARLAMWDRALGRDRVTIRPFDPAHLAKGDLMADVAAWAGLDPATLPAHVKRANTSLSLEAVALLYAFRRAHPTPPPDRALRRAEAQMVFTLKGFGSRRFAFAPQMLERPLARHAQDIAWAETRQGAAFAAAAPGPVTSFKALAQMAETLLPAFGDWLADRHPDLAREAKPGQGASDLLASLVAHFARAG